MATYRGNYRTFGSVLMYKTWEDAHRAGVQDVQARDGDTTKKPSRTVKVRRIVGGGFYYELYTNH